METSDATGSDREAGPWRTVGWVLLAWLAGIGALPFVSAVSVAVTEGLGLPEPMLGTVGVALVAAMVAWIFGRARRDPLSRIVVGGSYLLAFGLLIRLLGMVMPVAFVAPPLGLMLGQTVVAVIGAATYALLAQRREQLRQRTR